MKTDIQKDILSLIRNSGNGMMIEDISKNIGISRVTASKYLAILEAVGKVKHREVGRAKLFFMWGKETK
jgi:uncharacterized membrane protein